MAILDRAGVLNLSPELNNLSTGAVDYISQTDPYLKWALLTNFEGYSTWPGGKLPFLLHTPTNALDPLSLRPKGIQINAAYFLVNTLNIPVAWTEYATALVDRTALVQLYTEIVKERGGACKLGLPASSTVLNRPPSSPIGAIATPIFGIIDHSIAFANRAFRDVTQHTRIQTLWDQDPNNQARQFDPVVTGAQWSLQDKLGYGSILGATSVNRAVSKFSSEERLYRSAGYQPVVNRYGHGTHVLDVMAGKNKSPADAAANADILAVQLPWTPYKDTSGASLCVHILDALHWFRWSTDPRQPVVVNISDGAYAGPGRGRSLLERAMVNFVDSYLIDPTTRRFHLVIAAGNGALRRGRAQGCLDSTRPTSGPQTFKVLPDTPTDTVLEIWIDSANAPLIDFEDKIRVTAISPKGEVMQATKSSELGAITDHLNKPISLVSASIQSPDSPGQLGFVLIISPTKHLAATSARGTAPHGLWSVEIDNSSGKKIEYSIQIQRANPALGDKGIRREAEFVAKGIQKLRLPQEDTLNNIATGPAGIVVGGYIGTGQDWPDPAKPDRRDLQARYSSRGSLPGSAERKVDVIALSDERLGLPGILASGTRSGTLVRMNGTSVAAPQVARALYNALVATGTGQPDDATFLAGNTVPVPGSSNIPPKLR